MAAKLVDWSLHNRFLVIVLGVLLVAAGGAAAGAGASAGISAAVGVSAS